MHRAERIGLAGKDILFQLLVLCSFLYRVFHLASQAIHILSKILINFCRYTVQAPRMSQAHVSRSLDYDYSKNLNKR